MRAPPSVQTQELPSLLVPVLVASLLPPPPSGCLPPPHCADPGAAITAGTSSGCRTCWCLSKGTWIEPCQSLWGTCSSLVRLLQLPQVGELCWVHPLSLGAAALSPGLDCLASKLNNYSTYALHMASCALSVSPESGVAKTPAACPIPPPGGTACCSQVYPLLLRVPKGKFALHLGGCRPQPRHPWLLAWHTVCKLTAPMHHRLNCLV
jgi:hypothetical protein